MAKRPTPRPDDKPVHWLWSLVTNRVKEIVIAGIVAVIGVVFLTTWSTYRSQMDDYIVSVLANELSRPNSTIIKTVRTSLDHDSQIRKLEESVDSRLFDLKKTTKNVTETVDNMIRELNSMPDGFWIPVQLTFASKNDESIIKLPMSNKYNVRMRIFSEVYTEHILRKFMEIAINGYSITDTSPFFEDDPTKIQRQYFDGDKSFHSFKIKLKPEIGDDDFNIIKDRTVSILLVVERPIIVKESDAEEPEYQTR